MAIATVCSRTTGFARSLLVVALLGGTSASVGGQAFTVATDLPLGVYNLVSGGVVGAILVPEIARVRTTRRSRADLDRVLTAALVLTLVVGVLVVALAPLLVQVNAVAWPDSWRQLALAMSWWCLPQVLLLVLFAIVTQVLNAQHSYAPSAWAPVVANGCSLAGLIVFALVLGQPGPTAGGWSPGMLALLCGSMTFGTVAQAGLVVHTMRRRRCSWRLRLGLAGLRGPGARGSLTLAGVVAGQLAYLVVTNVANAASAALDAVGMNSAGLNSLATAYLVVLVPHGVIVVSIVTATQTAMSRAAATDQLPEVARLLMRTTGAIFLASAGFAALLVALGPQIGVALWGSSVIGSVLACLAVGSAAFSELYAINRALMVLGEARAVFVTQVVVAAGTAASALGVLWFVAPIHAVEGVALGISGSNVVGLGVGWMLVRRALRRRSGVARHAGLHPHPTTVRRLVGHRLRAVTAALASGLVAVVLARLLPAPDSWWTIWSTPAIAAAAGVIVFATSAVLLRLVSLPGRASTRRVPL